MIVKNLVFINVNQPDFDVVEDFENSERGESGFGSSGKK